MEDVNPDSAGCDKDTIIPSEFPAFGITLWERRKGTGILLTNCYLKILDTLLAF